jgi:hypothetical protein
MKTVSKAEPGEVGQGGSTDSGRACSTGTGTPADRRSVDSRGYICQYGVNEAQHE